VSADARKTYINLEEQLEIELLRLHDDAASLFPVPIMPKPKEEKDILEELGEISE
jgi:hypothetical protein